MSQIDFDGSPFDEGREAKRQAQPPRDRILQLTSITADTVLVTQLSEHRELAGIISGGWDRAGQSIGTRPFVATAIRARFGAIKGISIHLDGTPHRGLVIVMLTNPPLAVRIDDWRNKMTANQTARLHSFAREIVVAAWPGEEAR